MAARLNKLHQEDVRAKIQASQLINVLQNHALGKTKKLEASRLKAIEVLLRKAVPDLAAMTLTGPNDGPLQFQTITRRIVHPK